MLRPFTRVLSGPERLAVIDDERSRSADLVAAEETLSPPQSAEPQAKKKSARGRKRAARAATATTVTIDTPAAPVLSPAPSDEDLVAFAAGTGVRLDLAVLDRVCRAYNTGACEGWRPLTRAQGSVSLSISTAAGSFVLRGIGHESMSLLGLNVELTLMSYLQRQRFCIPRVLATQSGAQFIRHDGAAYVLLAAETGAAYDADKLTHLVAAAQTLAGYHHLVRDFPGPYRLGAVPYLPDRLIEDVNWAAGMKAFVSLVRSEQLGALEPVFTDLIAELRELTPRLQTAYRSLPRVMVHGAFETNALIFGYDGRAVQVNSLAAARHDLRLTDIADGLAAFCTNGPKDQSLDQDACVQFMGTYERFAPLSEAEALALPPFVRARRLHGFVNECRDLFDRTSGPEAQSGLVPIIQARARQLRNEPRLASSSEPARQARSRPS